MSPGALLRSCCMVLLLASAAAPQDQSAVPEREEVLASLERAADEVEDVEADSGAEPETQVAASLQYRPLDCRPGEWLERWSGLSPALLRDPERVAPYRAMVEEWLVERVRRLGTVRLQRPLQLYPHRPREGRPSEPLPAVELSPGAYQVGLVLEEVPAGLEATAAGHATELMPRYVLIRDPEDPEQTLYYLPLTVDRLKEPERSVHLELETKGDRLYLIASWGRFTAVTAMAPRLEGR